VEHGGARLLARELRRLVRVHVEPVLRPLWVVVPQHEAAHAALVRVSVRIRVRVRVRVRGRVRVRVG
jgi:hypothetical protein